MQTKIIQEFLKTDEGHTADQILRKCVHCGFCNATCPTYQLLGDELDGPRGRIYLIKQMLEGEHVTYKTQLHLDRCLTCLNCEITCPSGVHYGRLLEIGRQRVEGNVQRSVADRLYRWGIRYVLCNRRRFSFYLKLGRQIQSLLPASIQRHIPQTKAEIPWPQTDHQHKVILIRGCVQDTLAPSINTSAAQLLDKLAISAIRVSSEGCCGAISLHMGAVDEAKQFMKNNIDAWWPYINKGVEAIVSTASGCGVLVKDYARHLQNDPEYADKAKRISHLAKDVSEIVYRKNIPKIQKPLRIVFQSPCTLQHGQKLKTLMEDLLKQAGIEVLPVSAAHLCCGSAGTYSLLQEELSLKLRDNKLAALQEQKPDLIVSANIGCINHLQSGTSIPVKHWVELLA